MQDTVENALQAPDERFPLGGRSFLASWNGMGGREWRDHHQMPRTHTHTPTCTLRSLPSSPSLFGRARLYEEPFCYVAKQEKWHRTGRAGSGRVDVVVVVVVVFFFRSHASFSSSSSVSFGVRFFGACSTTGELYSMMRGGRGGGGGSGPVWEGQRGRCLFSWLRRRRRRRRRCRADVGSTTYWQHR